MPVPVKEVLSEIGNLLLDWVYPPHCAACETPLDGHSSALCGPCMEALRRARITNPFCDLCGVPMAGDAGKPRCLNCRAEKRHFDRARSIFIYAEPVRTIVQGYKFHGEFHLGPKLICAAARAGWLPAEVGDVDVVVPLPLHPRRQRERGYDQALMLARGVAKPFQRPVIRRVLRRNRYTAQQSLLPVTQRRANVRGAFDCARHEPVKDRRVLLVDDVMTTCATADECARVLKRAGAAEVTVFTLARATP